MKVMRKLHYQLPLRFHGVPSGRVKKSDSQTWLNTSSWILKLFSIPRSRSLYLPFLRIFEKSFTPNSSPGLFSLALGPPKAREKRPGDELAFTCQICWKGCKIDRLLRNSCRRNYILKILTSQFWLESVLVFLNSQWLLFTFNVVTWRVRSYRLAKSACAWSHCKPGD